MPLHAQDATASNTEARLRSALRDTTGQLHAVQEQLATLQAAKEQSDKEKADLSTRVDSLTVQLAQATKQSDDDKAAAAKALAAAQAQVTDLTGQLARMNDALAQWKTAYAQIGQLATTTEAARAKLAAQAATLQRTVEDRERRNLELYRTGQEILTRYEKFSLGEALEAKEPFVGTRRVRLETLVQDYRDRLLNGTTAAGGPVGTSSTHPAPTPRAQTEPVDPVKT